MGHRKKNAPKRGSLAYLPRGRAKRWRARIRHWPSIEGKPKLLAFCGYKAGMTHLVTIDNQKGSLTFGKEVALPVTVIDSPPLIVCAVRVYGQGNAGLRTLTEAWGQDRPKDLDRLLTTPNASKTEDSLKRVESSLEKIQEVRVLAVTQPRLANVPRKTPELIEIKVSGGTVKEQLEYAKSVLGKQVKSSDVFEEGQWVDVAGISKGKGIQGPVKRWGVKILSHKSRKTVRGVGSIGPWTPSYVTYTVPRAGQTGFHQRTFYGQRIIRISEDGAEVTPKGGFVRYGAVNGSYLMLAGSVPGPPKRLVTVRHSVRAQLEPTPPPKIEYLSLPGK